MIVDAKLKNITFPSEHQYVIIDTSDTPVGKSLDRLPMSFWIDYSRVSSSGADHSLDVPSLTLLINPSNMTLNYAKKITPTYARNGYIIEEWGEEQDVIQCSGKIGGYYIKKPSSSVHNYSGLNRYHRSKSLSFKNLYKLLYIFRNNGAIFQNTTKEQSQNKLISQSGYPYITNRVGQVVENANNRIDRVGDVYMNYDQTTYIGAFDSFSIKESADAPYTLEYSFQFSVQRTTTKDYRDYTYYSQVSLEGKDVAKNSKHVNTIVKSAIATQSQSRGANEIYLNSIKPKSTKPVATDSNVSSVTSNTLAFNGVAIMNSNNYAATVEDRQAYEGSFDLMNQAISDKNYGLYQMGKQNLIDNITTTIKRDNQNKSDAEAAAEANELAEEMLRELPKPSADRTAAITTFNADGTFGNNNS